MSLIPNARWKLRCNNSMAMVPDLFFHEKSQLARDLLQLTAHYIPSKRKFSSWIQNWRPKKARHLTFRGIVIDFDLKILFSFKINAILEGFPNRKKNQQLSRCFSEVVLTKSQDFRPNRCWGSFELRSPNQRCAGTTAFWTRPQGEFLFLGNRVQPWDGDLPRYTPKISWITTLRWANIVSWKLNTSSFVDDFHPEHGEFPLPCEFTKGKQILYLSVWCSNFPSEFGLYRF